MSISLRTTLKKAFPTLSVAAEVYALLVRRRDSYLHTTGWIRSLQENRPVDQDGVELPWMNYPVIEFLRERLSGEFNLFEFGSGYSTFFYARLVREVTSLEYDRAWHRRISSSLPSNVRLIFEPRDVDGRYCRVVGVDGRRYEVVVIDGRDRVNCIKQSIPALSEDGVMVLDDSDREAYAGGFAHAKAKGFSALTFSGLKPTGPQIHRTTIFYRKKNCLDI